MAHIIAQARLASVSGLAKDVCINTWSFSGATDEPTSEAIASALADFYLAIDDDLQSTVAEDGHEVRLYDRADDEPRAPYYTATFAVLPNTADDPMPREVAVCLSFAATISSGQPAGRRRGRVYIGPLATSCGAPSGAYFRPKSSFRTSLIDAYAGMAAGLNNDFGVVHEVWSGVDATGRAVVRAWVDNEWDTQRRRGTTATERTEIP